MPTRLIKSYFTVEISVSAVNGKITGKVCGRENRGCSTRLVLLTSPVGGGNIFSPSRAEIFLAFVVSDFTSRAVSIFASRYLTEKRKRNKERERGEEERDGVTQ